MRNAEIWELWKVAVQFDRTLKLRHDDLGKLARKYIASEPYSREIAFQKMAGRRVSVFRDVPVLVKRPPGHRLEDTLVRIFSRQFPATERARVQVGPSFRVMELPVREIMRRWLERRAIVGVTDLHIRGTRVEKVINTKTLSDFNFLIIGSDNLAVQEMMTLVIASAGNVTDSHSDDPDGTNHCFVGKKLWLVWDTFEGINAGLDDVERQDVYGKCSFDMCRFLNLKSSRWFLVATGETLFLPGDFTHKVLTLEPYLGVGSFHVGLPSSLANLTRWMHDGPLWSLNDPSGENSGLVDEVARLALRVAKRCQAGSSQVKQRWGFNWLPEAYRIWDRTTSKRIKRVVLQNALFNQLVEVARQSSLSTNSAVNY